MNHEANGKLAGCAGVCVMVVGAQMGILQRGPQNCLFWEVAEGVCVTLRWSNGNIADIRDCVEL